MATRSLTSGYKNKRTQLDNILTVWENRYKLRVLSKNLPRAIIFGLLASLIIGLIGYSQRILLAENVAIITLVTCGIAGLITLIYTQLMPRPRLTAAQYFDVEFSLKERVSTAIELLDGRIQTHPDIESMQISDALNSATQIDPKTDITMDFRQRELALMFALLVIALGMIIIPMIVGQDLPTDNPSPAVLEAQEDVRDITETIATDTDINDVDRDELLNALEIALERLQEEDISDEEAFAAMSQLESQLDEIENELQTELDLDQTALDTASQSLGEFTPPTESDTGDEASEQQEGLPTGEQLQQALDQIAGDAQNMTAEEMQAAADALNQAAQDLAQSNPELAQSLEDAAESLENGDSEAAQQQLQQAQQQLQQQQQQNQQNDNAQQTLQQQSDIAQQAADEISQQQSQQSQQQQGQADTQSDSQDGQSNAGQPSDQQAENAQPGDAQGQQQPNQNSPGDVDSEAQADNSDTSGQGAGEGDPSNASLSGGGGEDQGADTDNQTSGDQSIQYEAIYNPTGIDGGGDNEIQLETDASDQPIAEGDFDDNPLGQSQVSYDTVFSDYESAANRALESDYVPLGLRDVVRDYFTSLEPSAGN